MITCSFTVPPPPPNPPTQPLSPSNRLYKLCIVVLAILHTTVTNRLKFRAGSRLNLTNWPSKSSSLINQLIDWGQSISFPPAPTGQLCAVRVQHSVRVSSATQCYTDYRCFLVVPATSLTLRQREYILDKFRDIFEIYLNFQSSTKM